MPLYIAFVRMVFAMLRMERTCHTVHIQSVGLVCLSLPSGSRLIQCRNGSRNQTYSAANATFHQREMEHQQVLRIFLRHVASSLGQSITANEAEEVLALLVAAFGIPAGQQGEGVGNDLAGVLCVPSSGGATLDKPHLRQLRLQYDALSDASESTVSNLASAYWDNFELMMGIVVTVVESSWWPDLSQAMKQTMLGYVRHAPAPVSLPAMSGYLNSLTPMHRNNNNSSSATVSLAGGEVISQLFQEQFIDTPGCRTAIQQIVLYHVVLTIPSVTVSCKLESLMLPPCLQNNNASTATPHFDTNTNNTSNLHRMSAYQTMVGTRQVAGLLASLPDRLHHLHMFNATQPAAFHQCIMQELLHLVQHPQSVHAHHSGDSNCVDTASVDSYNKAISIAAAQLLAELMCRLCSRGDIDLVGSVLLRPLHNPAASATCSCTANGTATADEHVTPTAHDSEYSQQIVQALLPALVAYVFSTSATITGKLMYALLVQLSAIAAIDTSCPPWEILNSPQGQKSESFKSVTSSKSTAAAAAQMLHLLGGSHGIVSNPEISFVLTEQLLAHKTLPTSALLLLVQVLQQACADHSKPAAAKPAANNRPELTTTYWLSHLTLTRSNRFDEADTAVLDETSETPWTLAQIAAALTTIWGDVTSHDSKKNRQQAYGQNGLSCSIPLSEEMAAATAKAGTSLQLQGYLSCVLVLLLQRLTKADLEHTPGLLVGLLRGVSNRLASPQTTVRRQGMRVGRAISDVLDPSNPLFHDQGHLGLTAEEAWPGAVKPPVIASSNHVTTGSATQSPDTTGMSNKVAPNVSSVSNGLKERDDNSDDESENESDSDDDSLESFDLTEDAAADSWAKIDPQALQLRAVAAALRKSDNVTGVHTALSRVEPLIRAAPDELAAVAPELARALLHCRVPEWAEPDPDTRPDEMPEAQRSLSLAALLACAPVPAGDTLLLELFSPHLDTYQRLLTLQSAAAAAQELSHPNTPPQLQYEAGLPPKLVYPNQAPQAALPSAETQARRPAQLVERTIAPSATTKQQELSASKTRVWGHTALRKQKESQPAIHRSAFADVAVRWTAMILREVDKVKHGIDLLGRDSLVLTCLIYTLGVFAECAATTPAALPVCSMVLELLSIPQVHGHAEGAVRRAALLAAGQILAAVPPAAVAGIMDRRPAELSDINDRALSQKLQWVQGWLEGVEQEDSDTACQQMGGACRQLYTALAAESAIAALSLEAAAGPWPGLQGDSRPQGGGAYAAAAGVGSVVAGPLGLTRQQDILLPHHFS